MQLRGRGKKERGRGLYRNRCVTLEVEEKLRLLNRHLISLFGDTLLNRKLFEISVHFKPIPTKKNLFLVRSFLLFTISKTFRKTRHLSNRLVLIKKILTTI